MCRCRPNGLKDSRLMCTRCTYLQWDLCGQLLKEECMLFGPGTASVKDVLTFVGF